MSMKRTDLEKNKAIKLREGVQKAPVPTRFGAASTAVPDRREQRRLDHAAGLVPFACKLKDELVQHLRSVAEQGDGNLNALVERLIRVGLSAEGVRVPAVKKPGATQTPKKTAVKLPTAKAPVKTPAKPAAAPKAAAQKSAKPAQAPAVRATKPAAKKAAAKTAPTKKAAVTRAPAPASKTAKKAAAKKTTPVKAKKA